MQEVEICLVGFAPDDPVEVTVTLPGGEVRRLGFAGRAANVHVLNWTVMLSDPLGAYRMLASQGNRQASKAVTVKRASTPRAMVLPPSSQAVGGTFRIVVAGYPRGATVFPSLFQDGSSQRHLDDLPPIVMDPAGQGLLTLHSRAGDQTGRYCVGFRLSTSDAPGGCRASLTLTG